MGVEECRLEDELDRAVVCAGLYIVGVVCFFLFVFTVILLFFVIGIFIGIFIGIIVGIYIFKVTRFSPSSPTQHR